MAGTNGGTGQAFSFRCSKCRKLGKQFSTGYVDKVVLTGRKKDMKHMGNAHGRTDRYAREYRCLDCGHCGFSRHIDLMHKESRESEG